MTSATASASWISPSAIARQAVVYCRFLDHIERPEHMYHRSDPAERLHRVAELLASSQGPAVPVADQTPMSAWNRTPLQVLVQFDLSSFVAQWVAVGALGRAGWFTPKAR